MAIDRTKTFAGPFDLDLLDESQTSIFSISGLKKDAVTFGVESKEITEELEDDSEEIFNGGKKLVIECTFSEVDTADLDAIETGAVASVKITFTAKNKTITIDSPTNISVSIDSLKSKIKITKVGEIGKKISDLITTS